MESSNLQSKLFKILQIHPKLKLSIQWPWTEMEFKEIVWTVNDYLAQNSHLTDEDPLQTWLDEYEFWKDAEKRRVGSPNFT